MKVLFHNRIRQANNGLSGCSDKNLVFSLFLQKNKLHKNTNR